MVADLSGLQVSAGVLAANGLGDYIPYIESAGLTMGAGQRAVGATMAGALPFQQDAKQAIDQGIAGINPQVSAAQQGIANSLQYGADATQTSTQGLGDAATRARQAAAQGSAEINLKRALVRRF
jgi:hypothetical protein